MSSTVVTPQTPSLDEYGIVATFSEQSLDDLSTIQSQLSKHFGGAIWLTPRSALHVTLMEIICDKEYNAPRRQLFEAWYGQYNHIVTETLAELQSFNITFSQLEVSQRAIIVRLTDSHVFNDIRSRLLNRIKLPKGTKLPPDITHCSLARYNDELELDSVIGKTSTTKVNITQRISSFKLLKGLGPPTFQPKVIQTYELRT